MSAIAQPEPMTHNILRLPAVRASTGLSRSTIYARISEGLFPKPVSLGARAVGWPANEVESINSARISGRSNEEITRPGCEAGSSSQNGCMSGRYTTIPPGSAAEHWDGLKKSSQVGHVTVFLSLCLTCRTLWPRPRFRLLFHNKRNRLPGIERLVEEVCPFLHQLLARLQILRMVVRR